MKRLEAQSKYGQKTVCKIDQLYSAINSDNDIHVNGAITVLPRRIRQTRCVNVYANLCDKNGAILHILNTYRDFNLQDDAYYSFSMYCADVSRYFDIAELDHVEVYANYSDDFE